MMVEDEIRALNSDFNFRNYGQFYELEAENTQTATKPFVSQSIKGLYYVEKEATEKTKLF